MHRYPALPTRRATVLGSALVAALLGMAASPQVHASAFHVNGDTLYYTGNVLATDPQTLEAYILAAQARGTPLRQVVFRNSPGGAASGGVGMGAIIRQHGLDTVLDGGCYSACADAFVAGVKRKVTQFGLLPAHGNYTQTVLGIHGESGPNGPTPYPGQDKYIKYYRDMFGPTDFAVIEARIVQAHYELTQQSGFLRYFDPNVAAVATRFCPTRDQSAAGNCTAYPGVTFYSDRVVTEAGYVQPGDVLSVDKEVSGDLNPNLAVRGRYTNALANLRYFQQSAPDIRLDDAFGVIRIGKGGVWSLGTASAAQYVVADGGTLRLQQNGWIHHAEAIGARNGGRIELQQGALRSLTVVERGGVLTGHGSLNATIDINEGGTLAPSGIVMRPYSLEALAPGGDDVFTSERFRIGKGRYINLNDGANLAFQVDSQRTAPALTLEEARYFLVEEDRRSGDYNLYGNINRAVLSIAPSARLTLDIKQAFFPAGQQNHLVGTQVDSSALQLPVAPCGPSNGEYAGLWCRTATPDTLTRAAPVSDFIEGRFQYVERSGEAGSAVDLTAPGAVFRPRHNSLLSFTVNQTGSGLWLTANPSFDDTRLFGNAASGDGLGIALQQAAAQRTSSMSGLLGALQFADRDDIARQAGALRGDGHASLRLADSALVGSIGNVVQQHQAASRSGGDADGLAAQAAQTASAQSAMTGNRLFNQLAMHLVAPADAGSDASDAGHNRSFWARGFGSHGRIEGGAGIAGLNHTIGGIALGADTRLADDRVTLGVSLAAADMSTRSGEGAGFNGDVRALDIGGYVDALYSRGYLSAAVRYTDLRHDTRRSIEGIEGLQAPLRAKYSNDAISARVEHAFSFTTGNGLVIQPLLPVIDYMRTSATHFNEGQDAAALIGRSGSLESIRVGAGLQLFKTFDGNNGERITPRARVVWQKELGDTQARYSNGFAAAPDLLFSASSQPVGEQVLTCNLGVTSRASKRLSVMVDYVGERRDGQTQNGIQLGLGYTF
ncbi:autotransporter outer membrane beta-barrel domain-containing protein [Stenotrophomonas maltophilia]|uniref:autotransporter outer membrane beta-barrel domain-containing protein n=1 Tax=Stenotrophomonas maltophilia TaxID=40324 RepID=UPI000D68121D|nr:autotransporter domain-containing protein [Stenotrophomonas maltophilia]PWI04033.1 autotransporter outer membrane beta-barrel domain-containing protein [Stenotrophomonas maltophilia]